MTQLAPGYEAEDGKIVIDPAIAYPEILTALGVKADSYDQYWLEVAYQCAKLEAQRLIMRTEHDPRPDKPLIINITSRKDDWAIKNFPEGRGPDAATRGREARDHYVKWRGFIPGV